MVEPTTRLLPCIAYKPASGPIKEIVPDQFDGCTEIVQMIVPGGAGDIWENKRGHEIPVDAGPGGGADTTIDNDRLDPAPGIVAVTIGDAPLV